MDQALPRSAALEAKAANPIHRGHVVNLNTTSAMAFKAAILPRTGQHRLLVGNTRRLAASPSICPVCANASRTRRDASSRRSLSSTPPPSPAPTRHQHPRAELESTLLELQKRAPSLTNLSRWQLALQGLRQEQGDEVIRIAILGLAKDSRAGSRPTARRVLRALLADPLQGEQSWERELGNRDETTPLVVRVGPPRQHAVSLKIERQTGLDEMHVSSPLLDGLNLEFLLMEDVCVPFGDASGASTTSADAVEDTILVPAVEIPSTADKMSTISAPVHQALLVAEGLPGAVKLSALLPTAETAGRTAPIAAAVDFEGARFPESQLRDVPFKSIDVALAEEGVRLFRQGPQHGRDYERLWFASNVPLLMEWLRAGAVSTTRGETKPALRRLITSMLKNTRAEAQQQLEAFSSTARPKAKDPQVVALNEYLVDWAQRAHSELQQELDRAFGGSRWRKLGWWKLFWRVDDVAMLTNEMLSQRFMPTAEQELVHLAGRIAQLRGGSSAEYPQPMRSSGDISSKTRPLGSSQQVSAGMTSSALPKWPGHIAFTRRYLQDETVPALQSLAQRLVLESLGTSGLATSLAALLYVSSLSSTVYEAGAVAALGIVYSLGRVQKKWDAARTFWEGEVREEGRKAVRAAEESVAAVLEGDEHVADEEGLGEGEAREVLERTRELVDRAEDALARMK
ncbi:hypothetical protein E4U10_008052 [Claviceps purpurea]|nr:hypothetical protein E4U10_008052 [Claviceps purpurea]